MTREQAVKILKTIRDTYVDLANIVITVEADNNADALEMAIEALEQPEQIWFPVSERMPEAKQRVLVTFPDGTVDIKICIDAGHLKWFFAHMTAWMPLPEPYQSEVERRTK